MSHSVLSVHLSDLNCTYDLTGLGLLDLYVLPLSLPLRSPPSSKFLQNKREYNNHQWWWLVYRQMSSLYLWHCGFHWQAPLAHCNFSFTVQAGAVLLTCSLSKILLPSLIASSHWLIQDLFPAVRCLSLVVRCPVHSSYDSYQYIIQYVPNVGWAFLWNPMGIGVINTTERIIRNENYYTVLFLKEHKTHFWWHMYLQFKNTEHCYVCNMEDWHVDQGGIAQK